MRQREREKRKENALYLKERETTNTCTPFEIYIFTKSVWNTIPEKISECVTRNTS